MDEIANILGLTFEQKFLIASMCLSVEFLSNLVVERGGETEDSLMEQTMQFVKKELGSEISETKIDSYLKKILESYNLTPPA